VGTVVRRWGSQFSYKFVYSTGAYVAFYRNVLTPAWREAQNLSDGRARAEASKSGLKLPIRSVRLVLSPRRILSAIEKFSRGRGV